MWLHRSLDHVLIMTSFNRPLAFWFRELLRIEVKLAVRSQDPKNLGLFRSRRKVPTLVGNFWACFGNPLQHADHVDSLSHPRIASIALPHIRQPHSISDLIRSPAQISSTTTNPISQLNMDLPIFFHPRRMYNDLPPGFCNKQGSPSLSAFSLPHFKIAVPTFRFWNLRETKRPLRRCFFPRNQSHRTACACE